MGANGSSLTPEEIQAIENLTSFSEEEIKRLHRRFNKLDKDASGRITIDEFMQIPELATNPLIERVIALFDSDGDETVDFREFVTALSTFSVHGDPQRKLKFAFRVYDVDGDGFISNGELFTVLKMMVGANLTDVQLQQIVDKTIMEADKDRDGKISFEEFIALIGHSSMEQKLYIPL
uniref:EF-hand domain-containing protein n=1 Tax=Palpitomonas bilix TaxID=652834 RepID=A0A7S3D416_9EUKA|mmetsp:Transcript_21178/g.55075  ORF Transcript_21178/g.55075 Transcript_21178/m.55075 type:complete len:178 (+) Transcript_21178:221-754(+)